MKDDPRAPEISTRVAAAGTREHLFFGRPVFAEIAGEASLAALVYTGLTGRAISAEDAAVLDAIASAWTVADPRVWPMKVGRIVASYGNTLSGVAAATLAMNCTYIGPWKTIPGAAALLKEVAAEVPASDVHAAGLSKRLTDLLAERRYLPGFGVPFRPQDERLLPFRRCLERLGRHELRYFALFERLAGWSRDGRGLEPNIAAAVAAALLDLDVKVEEMGALGTALVLHMVLANAHEGAEQQAGMLKELPGESLHYVGKAPRRSPRAGGDD